MAVRRCWCSSDGCKFDPIDTTESRNKCSTSLQVPVRQYSAQFTRPDQVPPSTHFTKRALCANGEVHHSTCQAPQTTEIQKRSTKILHTGMEHCSTQTSVQFCCNWTQAWTFGNIVKVDLSISWQVRCSPIPGSGPDLLDINGWKIAHFKSTNEWTSLEAFDWTQCLFQFRYFDRVYFTHMSMILLGWSPTQDEQHKTCWHQQNRWVMALTISISFLDFSSCSSVVEKSNFPFILCGLIYLSTCFRDTGK